MKKKSVNKQIQLSPENYIRQKSRNLPIVDCFINSNWRESSMATIFIVRQHANRNVTSCMYLVDLNCLGVKDTGYKFNAPYEELESKLKDGQKFYFNFIKISYPLAHSIIYAGVEFAEKFGFMPCKDFTSITAYFLEEDTDDIPLIDIECGVDGGKPMYTNTGFDSPSREKQILAQLERTTGAGNYHFMLGEKGMFKDDFAGADDDFDDDFDDDDEDFGEEIEKRREELKALSKDEQIGQFFNLFSALREDNEVVERLFMLSSILSEELVGDAEVEEQLLRFEKTFDFDFVELDVYPNSLLTGVEMKDLTKVLGLFIDIAGVTDDENNSEKGIANLRKKMGDIPVTAFLESHLLKQKDEKKYRKKIKENYQKFPDYLLIQLCYFFEFQIEDKSLNPRFLEDLLRNKKQAITVFEVDVFFFYYTFVLVTDDQSDLPVLLAYKKYVEMLDCLSDTTYETIYPHIEVAILKKVYSHYNT
jgi:hypothetical protein